MAGIGDNSVERGVLSPFYERQAFAPAIFDEKKFPSDFPKEQWQQQSTRYYELNRWYSGDALGEVRPGKDGSMLSQFPLHINSLRAFVRKHAAVLFGEVPDGAAPLVKTIVRPRKRFDGKEVKESDKNLAEQCEAIINEVWTRSYGRSMMLENGKFSQYLGGSIFDCRYEPQRKDLLIPLVIRNPRPDYFLPEWSIEDRWTLLRGSTIVEIPAPQAKMQYGIGEGKEGDTAVLFHSFSPKKYSVMIDGVPLKSPTGKPQENLDNPFEVTPSIYIPHVVEGSNYGPTHIEDVAALLKEYNGRFADLGEAVLQTMDRPNYVSNMIGEPKKHVLEDGTVLWNLGTTPPASGSKDAPSIKEGTPPPVSDFQLQLLDRLWKQMLRDCDLSGIPFGEDEGSQRSGQTLALRMWPLLSHTREERTHWNDGLTRMGYIILKMVRVLQEQLLKDKMKGLGINIPENFEELIEISVEWSPQIPQDRAALVLELSQLQPIGMVSQRQGVTMLGNTKDVDAELAEIQKDKKSAADLASQQNQPFGGGKPSNGAASSSSSNGTSSNGSTVKASSAASAN